MQLFFKEETSIYVLTKITIRINELRKQNIESLSALAQSLSAHAQRQKLQQKQDSCGRKSGKYTRTNILTV